MELKITLDNDVAEQNKLKKKKKEVKKILNIYLEKFDKNYVKLNAEYIDFLINKHSDSESSSTDIASSICLKLSDNKTNN